MVPLIVISVLVSVLGSNPSDWAPFPYLGHLWSSQSGVVTKTKEKSQVAVAVDFHNEQVKAILGDFVLNRSSTPPLSIQAIHPQQLVRAVFCSIFFF